MKKAASIFIILTVITSLAVLTVNAQRYDKYYAVGGEILPFSVTTFLLNPWILAIAALVILLIGGAVYSGAITLDIVNQ